MSDVALITLTGIFTVFIVLLILMIVFIIFGKVSTKNTKKDLKKLNKISPKETISKETKYFAENKEDDLEEIAAISAAISYFMGNKKYKIRSIEKENEIKIKQSKPARWGSVQPVQIWRTNR
ncbi:MAG: glutaconyl-CoA/methylmalonyl-CoA decarboxylase subunit delta [Oceanotoga sp.]|uniref:OadG family protein n=1 Tax=Oceanotoga sp. TaxID=2108366 RepID=UPI002653E493|nr:OadG family protein [Oceanotoga sp.]MDN5341604.1 glutaconyl-CoA/methylmalonyl-CoA decarboxylase subunit delta [Oceanotoga sp.]